MFLTDSQPLDLLRSCLEDVPLEVLKASVLPNSVQKGVVVVVSLLEMPENKISSCL